MNKKGVTLIEILIVIGILSIVGAIAYPILFLNNKLTTEELADSLERNEVRAITNFLKEDIRDSINVGYEILDEPQRFRSTINYSIGTPVIYTRILGEDGSHHVTRSAAGKDISFLEVEGAEIYDLNPDLVQVKLHMKNERPEERLYEYKIARWRWQTLVDKGDNIYDFLKDENLFVFGAGFGMSGSIVNGEGATVYISSNLSANNLNGGAKIRVSNFYITGSVTLNGSQSLGSITKPGQIIVDGNVTLDGGSDIYGDIYVNGNLKLSGGAKIIGNAYVQGDFDFPNGSIEGNVYVNGNLYIKDGKILSGNIYVNKNVSVNWTPNISPGSKVYYFGTISHPSTLGIPDFQQMISQVLVPQKSVPVLGIPAPRDAQWYADNGYTLNGALTNNAKIYVTSGNYTRSIGGTISNVVVVNLGGNIKITGGGAKLSGVIYSPYGSVEIGGNSFTGLVIAAQGADMSAGGMIVNFQGIQTFISNSDLYPFLNEMMP